jgi:phosphopantothenoylcysteine decarboxylase/phosphopantothenate--cysteine ligase
VFYSLSKKDLIGKKVLVTAGPTSEPIDPVRIFTNRSSGKMGIAVAKEARYRGADITLIYGPGSEKPPDNIRLIHVTSVGEMAKVVREQKYDIFIGAAAVSDFTIKPQKEKIKSNKAGLDLHLDSSPKILSLINKNAVKVGFKAEHAVSKDKLIQSAKTLLKDYDLDMVVANDVGKGIFGSDYGEVILVKDDDILELKRMEKSEIAKRIFDSLVEK